MTYYISVPKQIEQVSAFGFDVLHVYGLNGARIDMEKQKAPRDPWIYYVCYAERMI
jgi:hypothetical protein